MAKWPNVPHCYGWLALDARGAWRMRDERAQHLNLPGDKVVQTALLGFINRNYAVDERGCWYFQNGPQRVYLNLEATTFIARTDPVQGLVLQTGEPLTLLDGVWLTAEGDLIVRSGGKVAQVDDRDVAQAMVWFELDGKAVTDEGLLAWLEGAAGALTLRYKDGVAQVQRIAREQVAAYFGFVRLPEPDSAASEAAGQD